ncbi:MAG: hypothetical protein Kow0077_07560 [Anaerolineae bacterium]
MNKKILLEEVRKSRQTLLEAMKDLPEDVMVRPGVEGIWSIKDILSHLIAWEAELVTALSRRLARGYKHAPQIVTIEDIDDWNMEQYHLNAAKPLDVILQDFHGVHKHLLRAIEDLDDKVLTDPLWFEWMEGEPLAYLILETAVWHEQEHAEAIRDWREQNNL